MKTTYITPRQEAAMRHIVPDHMIGGLLRYIEHGILPGGFLQAILKNDLAGACAHADDENKHRIYDYVFVLHNYAPSECWGSTEKVLQWVTQHKEATSI